MPTQNRSDRSKTVTKKPGKSKANESSQGRAQSGWRPSRFWEARVQCRWQGKVARKCKNLQWGKTTTNNITKTSWRFSYASTIARSFIFFVSFSINLFRKGLMKKIKRDIFLCLFYCKSLTIEKTKRKYLKENEISIKTKWNSQQMNYLNKTKKQLNK